MLPPTRQMLVELYVEQGLSIRQVAEMYLVTYRRARNWIRDHGIALRPRGHRRGAHLAPGVDRDEVARLRDAGLTPHAISQRFGIHRSTVIRILDLRASTDNAAGARRSKRTKSR